ncbi:PQQ-binding-like beta-propeller repeat protein [Streptomyces roseoviridis]|uniref:outer membrane protein assembly factor BamB family protein n=1 Tax=Streptomyces roseoviridis TaxID=67361 RepID=UPI0031E51BDB
MVDERGRRAVVHDHEGALIALDLENGAPLWRHEPSLRPCALLVGSVVALRISPSPTLVVVVLDADTGEDRWASERVALPPWARCTLDDSSGFSLRTETGADFVVLRWTVRASYRGGAAPSSRVLEESRHTASGAVRVALTDPPSLAVLPEAEAGADAEAETDARAAAWSEGKTDPEADARAGAWPEGKTDPEADAGAAAWSEGETDPEADAGVRAADGADARALPEADDGGVPAPVPPKAPSAGQSIVLDQCLVGERRLELVLRRDAGIVVLRAADARTGTPAWEVELDRTTPRRAPRLRP